MAVISHSIQYCRTPNTAADLVLGNAHPGKRSMITYLKSVTNKTQQDYLFQRATNGRKVAKGSFKDIKRFHKKEYEQLIHAHGTQDEKLQAETPAEKVSWLCCSHPVDRVFSSLQHY